MGEFLQKNWAYLLGAVLVHALFAGIFGLTMISMSRHAPPPQLAIQAVVVDQSVLSRASRQQQRERERERAAVREREQAAAEQQRKREQEVTVKREADQKAEQQRQSELKQRQEEDQRRQAEEQQQREHQETERKREAEVQKQRQAEAESKRVADIERKQKEEAERRKAAADTRAQEARENELRSQMEEEEGRDQAANSGLLNQYIAMIEQRIVRNWNRPPSARTGLECEVRVAQTPTGTVLSVQLGRCNGDAAVKQSIEAAVMRSSPLPPPPDPRLFERNLVLIFKPLDDG
jgi:colicin import membrane protein